jgi:pimeloyl-ACP methyl ester carboxylesterase
MRRAKFEEFSMPVTEINGFSIYYEIQGYGDPIFLLHHGFGCAKMWDKVVPLLVEHGYKTICYDRRGYGLSEPGDGFDDFYVSDGFRQAAVNELEAFRDWLGIDSFHAIGQCEGGVVGVDYAVAYPHRVKTLATSSTMCYSTTDMCEFNASKFTKTFEKLDPDLQRKLTSWHGERTERFFNKFRLFGGEYGKAFFDLRDKLQQLPCPTLVLYPDRSFLFEVEQGVAFYRSLPHGELAVLPRCGHNTYDEQPHEYVDHVVRFLARQRFGQEALSMGKVIQPVTCAG